MARLITFCRKTPRVHATAFLAPTATLIGEVVVAARANVWFGVVLRADRNAIHVGERASIQDNAVLHCNDERGTVIGPDATIGHGAVLEGCRVGEFALIGMNATILDGAVIGPGALIAAGSVVAEGTEIPPWTLAAGVPACPKRALGQRARERVKAAAGRYQTLLELYGELDGAGL